MEKTIYKLDTKGKERFITIKTEGDKLIQISGMVGTENPTEKVRTCKGKNIGKTNETTPEQQAILEGEAKIRKKLKVEYFETLEEANNTVVILPMLANKYEDHAHKIEWKPKNVYIQPKLDGVRAINPEDVIKSRKNEIIVLDHVLEELKNLKEELGKEFILDGELYAHGFNFQANQKMIGSANELVKFWVYDIIENAKFSARYKLVEKYVENLVNIELVPTYEITSVEDIDKYHNIFLEQGFEGSMIRHGDADYKLKGRSANLLKYKDFIDIACTIVDIIPCTIETTWGKPVLLLNDGSGRTFEAGTKMPVVDKEDFLINKADFIGKTAEIRFFEYFDSGIPRFPVYYGTRMDK